MSDWFAHNWCSLESRNPRSDSYFWLIFGRHVVPSLLLFNSLIIFRSIILMINNRMKRNDPKYTSLQDCSEDCNPIYASKQV